MLKHTKLNISIDALCDCVFVFVCLLADVKYVFQSVFVCGCQKASNVKLLDHNFSSQPPMLHNAKEHAGATSLTIMSLSPNSSYSVFWKKQFGFANHSYVTLLLFDNNQSHSSTKIKS